MFNYLHQMNFCLTIKVKVLKNSNLYDIKLTMARDYYLLFNWVKINFMKVYSHQIANLKSNYKNKYSK